MKPTSKGSNVRKIGTASALSIKLSDSDILRATGLLAAACQIEDAGLYIKPYPNTRSLRVKTYANDDTCESYLNLGPNLMDQVRNYISEAFGDDTLNEALGLAGLAFGAQAPEAPENGNPTRSTILGRKGA